MSIPLHEIWYYADAKVTLYNSSNIVSHTFADGIGVLSVASNVNSVGQWLRGTAITNVEIADNFTSIGNNAFRDCPSLALTSLPEGITSIATYAFNNCQSLALTSLPEGVTTIERYTFTNCPSLALTSLPEGVTTIGEHAFRDCPSLALTSLPEGITSIATYVFRNCTSLALTSLPEGVTTIENYAFVGCTSLALTSLPEGVTTIGESAFRDCTSLALTSLPEGITSIETYAFRNCTNIKFLVVNSYIPATLGSSTFYGTNFRIYVPSDKLNDYRSEWSSYASRIYPMSSISYIMTPDGFVHLSEDSIHRKRIVSQIRQTAVADNEHYPSEKCVAMIAAALQSAIDDVATDVNAKEDKANKVTTLDNSDTHYPTSNAVKTAVDGINNSLTSLLQLVLLREVLVNKVTSISAQSTDTQYPSAKAVYDAIQGVQPGTTTFGDNGWAYLHTQDGYRYIVFDADTERGSLVYLQVGTPNQQYDFYFENEADAAHSIHSLIVHNDTQQAFFIAFDENKFSRTFISSYGDGMTKPAFNLQPGSRVKLDFYLNSNYVVMTAAVI